MAVQFSGAGTAKRERRGSDYLRAQSSLPVFRTSASDGEQGSIASKLTCRPTIASIGISIAPENQSNCRGPSCVSRLGASTQARYRHRFSGAKCL